MTKPTGPSQLETRIADQIALLQADYYGVPPKGARAYVIPGEIVVVVLRETFTPAEKVLIKHGDAEAIQHSRRRFQQLSREDFGSVVEQATGEQVESFLSETNLEKEVAVEIFLMAGESRTHMEGFEQRWRGVAGKAPDPVPDTRDPKKREMNPRQSLGGRKGKET
jgi:uncharacterized protein YbcI